MEPPAARASATASVRPAGGVAPDGSVTFVRRPASVGDVVVHEHSFHGRSDPVGRPRGEPKAHNVIWRATTKVVEARGGVAQRYSVLFDAFEAHGDSRPKMGKPYLVWASSGDAQDEGQARLDPEEQRFFTENAAFIFPDELPGRLDGQTIFPGMRAPGIVEAARAMTEKTLSSPTDASGQARFMKYDEEGARFELDIELRTFTDRTLHRSRWVGLVVLDVPSGRLLREAVKVTTTGEEEGKMVHRIEGHRNTSWKPLDPDAQR